MYIYIYTNIVMHDPHSSKFRLTLKATTESYRKMCELQRIRRAAAAYDYWHAHAQSAAAAAAIHTHTHTRA